jgi:disulfide bond formation protein DsbB
MACGNQFTTRRVQCGVIGVCLLSLIIAYIAEYSFGIIPCDFCVYERAVYGAVLFIGILSFTNHYWVTGHRANRIQFFLLGVGIILTLYHIGMEYQWWKGPASCTGIGNATTLEAFRDQLMKARPKCDQVNWIIGGISATVWNLAVQIGLMSIIILGLYLRQNSPDKNQP